MLSLLAILLVTAHNLQAASVTKKNNYHNDQIVFPDDGMLRQDHKPAKLQDSLTNKFGEYEVHESCKDKTYCTIKPPNYPEEKFNELFKDYKIPPLPQLDVLGNRHGSSDFTNGCDSVVTFEPLYATRVKREDAWISVIQAPKAGFEQLVRLETCTSVGSSCFTPFMDNNESYQVQCEQIVDTWEVLVEGPDVNTTKTIKTTLPACCSCMYKRLNFFTRFNSDAAKESKSNKTKA